MGLQRCRRREGHPRLQPRQLGPSAGPSTALGGTIADPLRVSTGNGTTKWGSGPAAVTLSPSAGTPTARLQPNRHHRAGHDRVQLDPASRPPHREGDRRDADHQHRWPDPGLLPVHVRGYGTNSNGQPVTHLETVRFTVAATEPAEVRRTSSASPSSRSTRRRLQRHRRSRRDRHLRRPQRPDPAACPARALNPWS